MICKFTKMVLIIPFDGLSINFQSNATNRHRHHIADHQQTFYISRRLKFLTEENRKCESDDKLEKIQHTVKKNVLNSAFSLLDPEKS